MKMKDNLIYFGNWWIGTNKGPQDNDVLIGIKGTGGIKLKNFLKGIGVELKNLEEN